MVSRSSAAVACGTSDLGTFGLADHARLTHVLPRWQREAIKRLEREILCRGSNAAPTRSVGLPGQDRRDPSAKLPSLSSGQAGQAGHGSTGLTTGFSPDSKVKELHRLKACATGEAQTARNSDRPLTSLAPQGLKP